MTEEDKINTTPAGGEQKDVPQDHKLIELDGTVENASAHAQTHEKKLTPRELKHKRELEHKARLKQEKEQLKKMKQEQNPGAAQSRKKKLIVLLVIFVLMVGGFSVAYFKFSHLLPGLSHTSDSLDMNSITVDTVFQDSLVEDDMLADMGSESEAASQPKASNEKGKSKNTSTSSTAKSGNLSTPCWIISYASIANEDKASREVKKLADKGYIAGYYWIPDYDKTGKSLFKIYVGPFATKAEGKDKIPSVQQLSPGAYLMKLQ